MISTTNNDDISNKNNQQQQKKSTTTIKKSCSPEAGFAPDGDLPPAPTDVADAGVGIVDSRNLRKENDGKGFSDSSQSEENVFFFFVSCF